MTGFLFIDELISPPPGRTYRKRVKPPPPQPPLNLSQFTPPESRPVWIGQNIYIKPSYIVSIPAFSRGRNFNSAAFRENQKNLRHNQHNGELSKKAITGLRNAVNWLLISAKPKRVYAKDTSKTFSFKVNFITLTLPDTGHNISHQAFQKELLNPWLTYAKKYFGLKNYVWKLEFQKNGRLHAHITSDTFIHWLDLRNSWNRLLKRRGYLDKFIADHGHDNPNSTDVHATKNIKNLAAYLCKYMAKQPTVTMEYEGGEYNMKLIFRGRIWGCNYELSRANKTSVHLPADQCAEHLACLMNPKIEYKKLTRIDPLTKIEKQSGELFFLRASHWNNYVDGVIKEAFALARSDISAAARHYSLFEVNSLSSQYGYADAGNNAVLLLDAKC